MMKLDVKTIAILVLGLALIISFIAGQKGYFSNYKDEVKKLQDQNEVLTTSNDSLRELNNELDMQINGLNEYTFVLNNQLDSANVAISKLKKRRNEIPTKVNNMSSAGVANAFTDYLNKKSKSPNTSY